MLNQSFVSKISKYKLSIWHSERSYIYENFELIIIIISRNEEKEEEK